MISHSSVAFLLFKTVPFIFSFWFPVCFSFHVCVLCSTCDLFAMLFHIVTCHNSLNYQPWKWNVRHSHTLISVTGNGTSLCDNHYIWSIALNCTTWRTSAIYGLWRFMGIYIDTINFSFSRPGLMGIYRSLLVDIDPHKSALIPINLFISTSLYSKCQVVGDWKDLWGSLEIDGKHVGDINPHKSKPGFIKKSILSI